MKVKSAEKIIFYWLPVILWAAMIFTFSANPTTPTSEIHWQDFIIKKTLHILFYGIFATLLYRAFRTSQVGKSKAGYISIIIALLYGVTDEIHQSFTPGRMPRVYDVVFDTIGAILAVFVIWKLLPTAPKRLKNLARKWRLI